ncbi:hypothetical protein L3Q82_021613, partial [Scortum barcoo]
MCWGWMQICPEYLKSLDVVGAVLADTPLQHCMEVGDQYLWRGSGQVYAWVLERRIRPIVEPQIQEGLWEFSQPVHMCFVDLEKVFDRVPYGILWGVLHEYGVRGPLLRAVRSLYDQSKELGSHCQA